MKKIIIETLNELGYSLPDGYLDLVTELNESSKYELSLSVVKAVEIPQL